MYAPMSIEEVDYYLKPMNCPGHIMIYKSQVHSYRDLPIRLAELGTVYRYERSGTLHGMLRVRGFTQDDAHIFCTPEQVVDEVGGVIDLAMHMADVFGYEFQSYLATRPEKSIGDDEVWETATERSAARDGDPRLCLQDRRGRRRVLRPQDRHQVGRRARPGVDGTDDPGRLQSARALRRQLHRRGRRAAPGRS